MDDKWKALEIKRKYENKWLNIKGVTSVGIGKYNNATAIIVSYSSNHKEIKKNIPSCINNTTIIFQFSGKITAQNHD